MPVFIIGQISLNTGIFLGFANFIKAKTKMKEFEKKKLRESIDLKNLVTGFLTTGGKKMNSVSKALGISKDELLVIIYNLIGEEESEKKTEDNLFFQSVCPNCGSEINDKDYFVSKECCINCCAPTISV